MDAGNLGISPTSSKAAGPAECPRSATDAAGAPTGSPRRPRHKGHKRHHGKTPSPEHQHEEDGGAENAVPYFPFPPLPPLPLSPPREKASSSNTAAARRAVVVKYYLPVAVAVLVLVLVIGLQLLFGPALPSLLSGQQGAYPGCTGEPCRRYAQLFTQAMNLSAPACDDFYAHVCGRWDASHSRTGDESVLVGSWRRLSRKAASALSEVDATTNRSDPVMSAVQYVKTCISLLAGSRIEDLKAVLAAGNITWPQRNEHPDFLNSVFFMARRVFRPIFFDVTTQNNGRGTTPSTQRILFFGISRLFEEHLKALRSLLKSGQLAKHVHLVYQSLRVSVDEQRVKELATQYEDLGTFLNWCERRHIYATRSENASFFLQYTPTVPKSRWNSLLKNYLNVSLSQHGDDDSSEILGGVEIETVDDFAAVFDIHAKHGEGVTDDIVGGLCVQMLLEYVSVDLLASLRGGHAVASQLVYDRCFGDTYTFYEYAVNSFLLKSLTEAVTNLRNIVADVHVAYHEVLRGNQTLFVVPTNSIWLVPASQEHEKLDAAVLGLERLSPSELSRLYGAYPVVSDSPLSNWMEHAAVFSTADFHPFAPHGSRSVTWRRRNSRPEIYAYRGREAGRFHDFRISLVHMEEPFYVGNISAAVVMAGIGSRIAAANFYDHVEGGEDGDPAKVYARNHDCLFPGATGADPEVEVQGAVASIGIAWYTLQSTSSTNIFSRHSYHHDSSSGDIAFLKRDQVFFVFFCYLFCGEQDGARMCNVPLQQSEDFAHVFGCPRGSPMNPSRKCRMDIHQ